MSRRKIIGTLRVTKPAVTTLLFQGKWGDTSRQCATMYIGTGDGGEQLLVVRRITRDHPAGTCTRWDGTKYIEWYEILINGELREVSCSDVRRHTDEV